MNVGVQISIEVGILLVELGVADLKWFIK